MGKYAVAWVCKKTGRTGFIQGSINGKKFILLHDTKQEAEEFIRTRDTSIKELNFQSTISCHVKEMAE